MTLKAKLQRIVITVNQIRLLKGMSQRQLAEKAKIHPNTIARVESGERDCYNLHNLLKICDALDIKLSTLLIEAQL